MTVKPIFAWYDLWVGAFWDAGKRRLYVFPVPMLGVVIQFAPKGARPERPFLTEGRLSTVAVIVTMIGLVAWSSWGIARRVAELRPQPRRCFVEELRGGGGMVTWCEPIAASTAKVRP